MRRTYLVPVARAGTVGLMALLFLLGAPGTTIASGASEEAQQSLDTGATVLQRGAGYGPAGDATRVRALQHALRELDWRPGPADGLFGPRTERAVVRFQAAAGLSPDGKVGPHTARALNRSLERPLSRAAGYAQPGGSRQVRRLQRELRREGLRPGPVDGRFGPRTEAAVARLEQAAGFKADGAVDRRVLRRLSAEGDNRRTAATGPPATGDLSTGAMIQEASADAAEPASVELIPTAISVAIALILGALGGLLLSRVLSSGTAVPLTGTVLAEGRARARSIDRFRGQVHALVLGRRLFGRTTVARYLVSDSSRDRQFWVTEKEVESLTQHEDPRPTPTGEPVGERVVGNRHSTESSGQTRALGYVCIPKGDDNDELLREQADPIDAFCRRRGWPLLELVRDVDAGNGKSTERPGLLYAVERMAKGEASCLVVAQASRLSHSAGDLGRILEWIARCNGRLLALDVGLDTASAGGRTAANTLISVGAWERGRLAERTRKGLAAARASRTMTGRPAVEDVPALKARIVSMRADGLTLQAISDHLNAEGVPTLRGGKHWRPSSVQAAAGYRRPPREPKVPNSHQNGER